MDNTILYDIKKTLGIPPEEVVFDNDILIHTNTAVYYLQQSGIEFGEIPIIDSTTKWEDIPNFYKVQPIRTYIFLYVKVLFDPPQNTTVTELIQKQMDEILWRLSIKNV